MPPRSQVAVAAVEIVAADAAVEVVVAAVAIETILATPAEQIVGVDGSRDRQRIAPSSRTRPGRRPVAFWMVMRLEIAAI